MIICVVVQVGILEAPNQEQVEMFFSAQPASSR